MEGLLLNPASLFVDGIVGVDVCTLDGLIVLLLCIGIPSPVDGCFEYGELGVLLLT